MKVLKMFIWIPIVIIAVYLALMLYIYINQDKMVFYPTDDFTVTPENYDLPYENIYLEIEENSESINLHGWYFPSTDSANTKAVLFCHGNAGNISHRLETAKYLHDLGVATFMFDYRGYGYSTGDPSETGVYQDAQLCFNWLVNTKNFKPENIIIFGRSLGGAVAIELAGQVNSGGLIVESSFTSVGDLGQKMFPLFPIKTLIRYSFNSLEKIKDVKAPTLITHSPGDKMIPISMGEKLFDAANEPKQFIRLSGGHNSRTYFDDQAYKEALEKLLYGEPTDKSKQ